MRSKVVDELLKEISLEDHIKTVCEMAFIDLLSDLGYREDEAWTDDEDELLSSLIDSAHNLASSIMQEIRDYERPTAEDFLKSMDVNDFFKEAWNIYQIVLLEKFEKDTMIAGHTLINLDSFINKILNDEKFAKEWGFKVDTKDLSFNDRWIKGNYQPFNIEGMVEYEDGLNYITEKQFKDYHNSKMDKLNIPNKLITITYKNNTIEIYVLL